jgi:ferrochelatase
MVAGESETFLMLTQIPPDHPQAAPDKIGVLLLNLGTPDATDFRTVRRYLKEFLSDARVIEVNRVLWWLILNGIILNVRPQKSGHAYTKIWDREANDSPLRVISRRQAEKLQTAFAGEPKVIVDFAMRYGNPSTESRLRALQAEGCQRILLVPLYPQYSATTTATANDAAFDVLKKLRWQPSIRTMPPYFADPAYVAALAESIDEGVKALDFTPDLVITSYHGMPVEYLLKGDPYYCDCLKTTRLVREHLGWPEERLMVTFQSRFGRDEWLQPYTAETFAELPKKGVKRIAVVTPAFSVDCIETLEEIAITGREQFLSAGGEAFAHIPCLNDSPGGMRMLEAIVRQELAGWI